MARPSTPSHSFLQRFCLDDRAHPIDREMGNERPACVQRHCFPLSPLIDLCRPEYGGNRGGSFGQLIRFIIFPHSFDCVAFC